MNKPMTNKNDEPMAMETAEHFAAKVARAFIELSVQDGDDSSGALSQHLAAMQGSLVRARYELEKVTKIGVSAKTNRNIGEAINECISQMAEAMVALQFFDRVAQRLNHASRFLESAHTVATDDMADAAMQRRERLRFYNILSMEEERSMFRALEEGADVKSAVRQGLAALKQNIDNPGDHIELF